MKKAFLVVMQDTDRGPRWANTGPIQMVEADDSEVGAYDIALDYALDNEPDHRRWRVLAWEDVEDGFDVNSPHAEIYPEDMPKFGAPGVIRRPAVKKHQPRVYGPVFECVRKVPATEELALKQVLITDDPQNCAGERFPGTSWYPAQAAEGAVSACVQGWGFMKWRGKDVFSLHTAVGEVRMNYEQPVIVED